MLRQPLKSRLKNQVLWRTGLLARREARQTGACILNYHGIVPTILDPDLDEFAISEDDFVSHLRHLRRRCAPIALGELLDALRTGAAIDHRWVVLTFDDALQNQVERGATILADFRMPWSLAVSAGLIGTERTIWSYELKFSLLHCWNKLLLPDRFSLGEALPTHTHAQRLQAFMLVRQRLVRGQVNPVDFVTNLIEECDPASFRNQLATYQRYNLADWTQLQKLSAAGVEMLAHGHYHLPQKEGLAPADRQMEFVTARDVLEKHLGRRPRGFAFPHGITCPTAFEALAPAGYDFALTTTSGRVTASNSLRMLPRFNADFDLLGLRRRLLTT